MPTLKEIVGLNKLYNLMDEREAEMLPRIVELAEQLGYIVPGWSLIDYLIAAVKGYPDDPIKKAGFENVVIWGKQGSYKSNLAMQLSFEIYQDWDWVLRRLLLQPQDAIKIYKETRETGKRIPLIILDDITTIFPKQLWFINKELFTLLQQFIATIRMRFSNIISTTPIIDNIVSALAENITFEALNTPKMVCIVERYMWMLDRYYAAKSRFKKVVVECFKFNPKRVPSDVWKEYEDRRWAVTDEIVSKIEKKFDLEKLAVGKNRKELKKLLPSKDEVIAKFRSDGYKISQQTAYRLLMKYEEALLNGA